MPEGDTQTQTVPGASSSAVAIRPRTQTEQWLSRQTGVEILETQHGLVLRLPPTLRSVANMLVPASQIVQVNPNFTPTPRLVDLDIGEHAYEEKNAGRGKYALNAKALDAIAGTAGISWDPPETDFMAGAGFACKAIAHKRGADGTMESWADLQAVLYEDYRRTARREREEQIARWDNPPAGDALEALLDKHVDEQMKHVFSKTTTKAKSRVIRHWLAIKSTYTKDELAKPFLIVQWAFTPDRSDPHVGQLIEAEFGRSRVALYGTRPQPQSQPQRQLAPVHDPEPARPENVDANGEIIDPDPGPAASPLDEIPVTISDADVVPDERPARPQTATKLTGGPYQGMTVDAVCEDEDGRAWLLASVGRLRNQDTIAHMLAWLSHYEGRVLTVADCAALARERQGQG